ncbi:dipeptidase [Deinococcus peraridilitoris]|uniref:Acetylornithine deacetylase/succinyldiaminopimelate desuccinylase-like deacylase n=1 Tax=Deinococcus peraridilitoris (strain DSM 19664 / LMG 22246 / CIP 109416 / KR-200) TaxID=937777 RepID=L0A733_DEIPD|nr:dipeptidase [Deinococcus peraridilitoris]AFZ69668.1 acetylornithine deacetylase/succinyldiaminopimelate desuccinylase-like deacylase [Deinococcus peraridilitoris DSM 19664]
MKTLPDVQTVLDARRDASLVDLVAFASIPSVSAQHQHRHDLLRAAEWLAERLRACGELTVEVWPTAGHPAVYAEWLGAPGAPTALIYGHYDVQPPEPLERWNTPPFTPTVRDGRLYGRGVSDDKGPLLIPVQVADAFFTAQGALPINVKFLFEGEEEVGSAHLDALVSERRERLRADFVLSADGGMWSADTPSLTVSARGIAALEFTLRGPAKDLHSGRHGGALQNPLHALAALVASLHDESGRVTVAGFYDGVQDRTPEERAETQRLPFSDEAYLQQTGANATFGEAGYSTLERQWYRPTLELNGLWGGYTGEGSKTVLPSEAHAKITCRLVPGQDPQHVTRQIIAHLHAQLPPGVTLEVQPSSHAAPAYHLPTQHPARSAAKAVLHELYGTPPLEVGMGGSIPVLDTFSRVLGIDTVFFSFAVGDEDIHAPNEFFRIERLAQGQRAWALLWQRLAQEGRRA